MAEKEEPVTDQHLLIREFLSKTPVFQEFPPTHLDLIANLMETRQKNPGEAVFDTGEAADGLYIVVSGEVKAILHPSLTRGIYHPGDSFGEMALISDQPRSFAALATEKTQLYFLSKESFEQFLSQNLDMMRIFVLSMSKRLVETSGQLFQEDETGMLAEGFNSMVSSLREYDLLKQAVAGAGFQLVETRDPNGQVISYQLQQPSQPSI